MDKKNSLRPSPFDFVFCFCFIWFRQSARRNINKNIKSFESIIDELKQKLNNIINEASKGSKEVGEFWNL